MAEQLGEAVLVLRTDDQGLDRGIGQAKPKAEALGHTLDDTSDSAKKLGKSLKEAGDEGGKAAEKTTGLSRDVQRLKASIDPAWGALQKYKEEAQLARKALDEGAISHRQYVDEMRRSASAAGLLTNAGKQVVQATGAQRAGLQQLTMNLGDAATMYSMNARPAQIFASQIGQVTQALQLMSGGTSKVAMFLGGPWGVALTVAAQVGGPLIAMLLDTDDAAKKAAKGSETFADQLDRQKHSLQEVIAAVRDYNVEMKKARESALDNAIAAAARADASMKEALAERQKLAAKLEDDRVAAQAANRPGVGRGAGQAAQLMLSATESAIKANEASIADLQKQQAETRANFADELSKMAADPTLAVKRIFEQRRENARETIKDVGKLTAALTELRKQEEAALDKVRKREKSSSPSGSSASANAGVGDMTALIQDLFPGARITSTTGGKHGKGSDHYAGRAIDFVPQGGMGTYTTAEVEKILEDAGVTIRRNAKGTKQLFGPGRSAATPGDHDDHFHVAWSGGASPEEAARRKQQADEREARAKEQEAQRVERYTRDLAGLQDAALDIEARLADTAEERFQLESRGLAIAIAEQARRIEANADYTRAEKDKLLAALEVKAALERDLLAKRKQEELARQQLEIAQAMRSNARDLLQAEGRLAETREERRDIELRLLDLTYEQERAALDAVIASKDATEAQKKVAQARLGVLEQLKAGDSKAIDREHESPLERYRREIMGVGKNINDELEGVAVNGLERLSDGLADVAMGTRSLGDAFKQMANEIIVEILRIWIRQKLILPLLNSMGIGGGAAGAASSGSSGLVAGDGTLGALPGLPGSSGGGVLGSVLGSIFKGFFADGGLIPEGGFGIVGERGPEPVFATRGGVGVLPNSALRSFGGGGGSSGFRDLNINVNGARGDREIRDMVREGVRQGIAGYDHIVSDRVKEQLERRG
jgi:hypothetical protein